MGGDVLQGFEPVLDKPEDRAPPVCGRVLGYERTQVVTFMGACLLPLYVSQVHPPMIQDLTGEGIAIRIAWWYWCTNEEACR